MKNYRKGKLKGRMKPKEKVDGPEWTLALKMGKLAFCVLARNGSRGTTQESEN